MRSVSRYTRWYASGRGGSRDRAAAERAGVARRPGARDAARRSCRRCWSSTARGSSGSSMHVAARGRRRARAALAEDELVAHLLLLHGLHPVAVRGARAGGARGGAALPGVARRQRRAARASRRASCACGCEGSCSGLPVLDDDARSSRSRRRSARRRPTSRRWRPRVRAAGRARRRRLLQIAYAGAGGGLGAGARPSAAGVRARALHRRAEA